MIKRFKLPSKLYIKWLDDYEVDEQEYTNKDIKNSDNYITNIN